MVQADAAAQSCKIELHLTQDLRAVEGDPTQIQQVLINLVLNAFDAMRDAPPSRRVVDIATDSNGDGTIGVAVRDYGSGISETTRERLFEQFFTTKDDGLGMGLAIVRSIIRHTVEPLQPKTLMEAERVSIFVCQSTERESQ